MSTPVTLYMPKGVVYSRPGDPDHTRIASKLPASGAEVIIKDGDSLIGETDSGFIVLSDVHKIRAIAPGNIGGTVEHPLLPPVPSKNRDWNFFDVLPDEAVVMTDLILIDRDECPKGVSLYRKTPLLPLQVYCFGRLSNLLHFNKITGLVQEDGLDSFSVGFVNEFRGITVRSNDVELNAYPLDDLHINALMTMANASIAKK